MTFETFNTSVQEDDQPPAELSEALKALWYAGRDEWEEAHNVAQDMPSSMGSWIHAYLHRVEGDIGNAGYWYARAGQPAIPNRDNLRPEWENLVHRNLVID